MIENNQLDAQHMAIGASKFRIPMPPKFTNKEQQRQYEKQRLAAGFRAFALHHFDEGLAGHITLRDCIEPDTFWVNPLGVHFKMIKATDLVRIDHNGNIVEGAHAVNNAAFAIHSRVHMARPDVNAVAHAHTKYGRAFSCLGQLLKPISQDACIFYENQGLFSTFTGVVADKDEGDMIAESLAQHCAVILQNHGLITVGSSVDAAVANFILMDSCCQSQLLAQAAGSLTLIEHDIALKTRAANGSELVTWGNFQPLYAMLEDRDPSFLE
ncbi:class II aldolase/adducin family protein [Paraglaciecola polaris]|uniref:Adducin-related protein C1289.14 n=1 Tax=Paraglaciecola polaris LMG 21857 TaxID=1129793 RepID=K6ZT31_9ALTE|nr:class II aldolase/adducin family protein [Paraglaciecola polaris]GAC31988.1 adducin-related protein C1289.14 [Paraglaciecola polaris LMG 21857]